MTSGRRKFKLELSDCQRFGSVQVSFVFFESDQLTVYMMPKGDHWGDVTRFS